MSNQIKPTSMFPNGVQPSPLLARLEAFIPQIKSSNEQLKKDIELNGFEKYNIENTDGCEEKVVMSLQLGILEPKSSSNIDLPDQKLASRPPLILPWEVNATDEQVSNNDTVIHDNDDISDIDTNNNQSEPLNEEDFVTLDKNPAQQAKFESARNLIMSNQHDNIITSKDALDKLRALGYEAVHDISAINPLDMNDADTFSGNDGSDEEDNSNDNKFLIVGKTKPQKKTEIEVISTEEL